MSRVDKIDALTLAWLLAMISVRAALDIVVRDPPLLGSEYIALPQALGRVLSDPVSASREIPPCRNAAMDGYAVRAADVATAGPGTPARLRDLEVIGAGSVPGQTVTAGCATKIMTGSPMPEGADAVVRVEDTEEQGGHVRILA